MIFPRRTWGGFFLIYQMYTRKGLAVQRFLIADEMAKEAHVKLATIIL